MIPPSHAVSGWAMSSAPASSARSNSATFVNRSPIATGTLVACANGAIPVQVLEVGSAPQKNSGSNGSSACSIRAA